ncbi:hypothetical protein R4R77_002258 [Citrobacter amalonaticus]|uniref:Uncharacterized protein n=1 Tax=Citrobacter amalonaticus TaxID=35703 RepID=A0AAW9M7R2_CITAM|nr:MULTISPECIES: hypothetical protein [Citrobacter]MDV2140267.1 hypothetical protein [Citrobacter amalonaticus]MEB0587773.1 hypothetical protein [Citrobacter amalonaticus]SAY85201.1 protein of unknown function [Citrobacter amalonaticus]SAZ17578.1 protein of unknown function [Citrobacter amalonaticus]
MMAAALICLGDKTSYGEIISVTASRFEVNKAIARIGDKLSCSICDGYFELMAQNWTEEGLTYVATGESIVPLPRPLRFLLCHTIHLPNAEYIDFSQCPSYLLMD